MLQLSQRARLRAQPGFICTSCRHVLLQQQQLTTSSTSHSQTPSASVASSLAAVSSTSSLSTTPNTSRARVPRYPHSFKAFRRRPFSTTTRPHQSQNDDGKSNGVAKETHGPSQEADAVVVSPPETLVDTEPVVHDTKPVSAADDPPPTTTPTKKKRKKKRSAARSKTESDPENNLLQVLMAASDKKDQGTGTKQEDWEGMTQQDLAILEQPKQPKKKKTKQEITLEENPSEEPEKEEKKRGRLSNNERLFKNFKPKAVNSSDVKLVSVELGTKQPPVPRLSHGLDRVLFNPGVYHLQDPRTRVYNFDPYLARIMPVKEFDWTAIKKFVSSSKDTTLRKMAVKKKRKYTGSTSSMTSILSHFHFLLSEWRPMNTYNLSRHLQVDKGFSPAIRAPSASFLHYNDGVYAIDADKEFDSATVLSMLGHSMEKLFTLPKEEFEKYRRPNSDQLADEDRNAADNTYQYTTIGDFLFRSQLDAADPRLPGTGSFDVKTRAVVSIRNSFGDMKGVLGYEIRNLFGQWESFEREYFDLIRNAFLKYSLQVRMGRMDGCFVAYHNTERIFGFQYIPLSEMDMALHGTPNPALGDSEFNLSLHLFNKVLDKVVKKFPKRSLRLHVETRPTRPAFMYIFAEPVTKKQIKQVQEKNREQFEKFEQEVLGMVKAIDEAEANPPPTDSETSELDEEGEPYIGGEQSNVAEAWEDMMYKAEEALKDEQQGLTAIRESIESALLQSGIIDSSDSEESRRYVHALAGALTTNGEAVEPAASESQTSPLPADEESIDDGATVASDAATSLNPEKQESDLDIEMVAQEEASLKDLVLRLASQVKAGQHQVRPSQGQEQERGEQGNVQDIAGLQKFIGILSELAATNRDTDSPTAESPDEDGFSAEPIETEESAEFEEAAELPEYRRPKQLLGLMLTIKNKVNDMYVHRPLGMHPAGKWEVEYVIEEMDDEQAQDLYIQVRKRREYTFDKTGPQPVGRSIMYDKLAMYAKKGRKFRHVETATSSHLPVHVYGVDDPLTWDSVFGGANQNGVYEKWESKASPGVKWEESAEREQWGTMMRSKPRHIPEYDYSSTYYENHPGKRDLQLHEMLKRKKALEYKIKTMQQLVLDEEARQTQDAASQTQEYDEDQNASWFRKTLGKTLAQALAQKQTKKQAKVAKDQMAKQRALNPGEMSGLNLNDLPEEDGS